MYLISTAHFDWFSFCSVSSDIEFVLSHPWYHREHYSRYPAQIPAQIFQKSSWLQLKVGLSVWVLDYGVSLSSIRVRGAAAMPPAALRMKGALLYKKYGCWCSATMSDLMSILSALYGVTASVVISLLSAHDVLHEADPAVWLNRIVLHDPCVFFCYAPPDGNVTIMLIWNFQGTRSL